MSIKLCDNIHCVPRNYLKVGHAHANHNNISDVIMKRILQILRLDNIQPYSHTRMYFSCFILRNKSYSNRWSMQTCVKINSSYCVLCILRSVIKTKYFIQIWTLFLWFLAGVCKINKVIVEKSNMCARLTTSALRVSSRINQRVPGFVVILHFCDNGFDKICYPITWYEINLQLIF